MKVRLLQAGTQGNRLYSLPKRSANIKEASEFCVENCFCRMIRTFTGPQILEPNTAPHERRSVWRCLPVGGDVTYLLAFQRSQFALKKQCVVVLLSHLSVKFTSVFF